MKRPETVSIQSPILQSQTGTDRLQNPSNEICVNPVSEECNNVKDKSRQRELIGRKIQLADLEKGFWMCKANMIATKMNQLRLQHEFDYMNNEEL